MANWRALMQVLQHGDPRRVSWDKTTHDFPSVTGEVHTRYSLGQILLKRNWITQEQLDQILSNQIKGLRLGGTLIARNVISTHQLAEALSEQYAVPMEEISARAISTELINKIPANVALRYGILPLRKTGEVLTVASENGIDPVSLAALSRKLNCRVNYVIVPRGQVVTGLRYWYARQRGPDQYGLLQTAIKLGWLNPAKANHIWREFESQQILFVEVLTSLGHITRSAMNALLLQHERSNSPLGQFLVEKGIVSEETLQIILQRQQELQTTIRSFLLEAGLSEQQILQVEQIVLEEQTILDKQVSQKNQAIPETKAVLEPQIL